MNFDLNVLWFILVAVLFIGFFFLEGFDYGVGILLPFVAKNDRERREVINTIGPVWDGNEVWLLTAGGAIFAAFPNWYATLFSGFYLALFLILLALIARGVAFEFRSKLDDPKWRSAWDWAIFVGSLVPGLLWGVAFANIVRGLPIDETMTYTGGFFYLLNPYSLLGGLVTLGLFALHGGLFLSIKTDGAVRERVEGLVKQLYIPVVLIAVAFVVFSFFATDIYSGRVLSLVATGIVVVALLAVGYFVFFGKTFARAFIASGVGLAFVVVMLFSGLFPRVMPSTLGFDLTIYNASSSPYTLQVMTIVALIFVPIVLAYQGWTYWVFGKRITSDTHLEY